MPFSYPLILRRRLEEMDHHGPAPPESSPAIAYSPLHPSVTADDQEGQLFAGVGPLRPAVGPRGPPKKIRVAAPEANIKVCAEFSTSRLFGFPTLKQPRGPQPAPRQPKRLPRESNNGPREPRDGARGAQDGPRRPKAAETEAREGGARTENPSLPPGESPRSPQEALKRPQEAPNRLLTTPHDTSGDLPKRASPKQQPSIAHTFLMIFIVFAFSASRRSKTAQKAPKTAPRQPKRPPRESPDGPSRLEDAASGAEDGSGEPQGGTKKGQRKEPEPKSRNFRPQRLSNA